MNLRTHIRQNLLTFSFLCTLALLSACSGDDDTDEKKQVVAPQDRWKEMFIEVPPMITPRNGGQPVLLNDGRLLVIGGYADNRPVDDQELFCEFYDPATNKWTETNWKFPLKGFGSYRFSGGSYANGRAAIFTLPNGHVIIGGGWGLEGPIRGIYELDPNDSNPANIKFYPFDRFSDPSHLSCTGIIALDDGSIVAAGGGHIVNIKDGVSRDVDTNYPTNVGLLSITSLFYMGGKKFFAYVNANELRFYDLDKKPTDVIDYMRDFYPGYKYFEVLGTQIADSVFLMGGGYCDAGTSGRGYRGMFAYKMDLHKNKRIGRDKDQPANVPLCVNDATMNCVLEVSDLIRLKDGRYHMFLENESRIYNPVSGSVTPGYNWSAETSEYLSTPEFYNPGEAYIATELPSGDLFVAHNKYFYEVLNAHSTTKYYIIKKP
jgi:hypothetical protein